MISRSLLGDGPKTYRIICYQYGNNPWGIYAWDPIYNSLEEAEVGIHERYPGLKRAEEVRWHPTSTRDFEGVAREEGRNVLAVYIGGTAYVERCYFVPLVDEVAEGPVRP